MRTFRRSILVVVKLGLACLALLSVARAIGSQTSVGQAPPAKISARSFREELIAELPDGSKIVQAVVAGEHIAIVVKKDRKKTVWLDGGRQGGVFDEVSDLILSPNGSHLAFKAHRELQTLILDGMEFKQYLFVSRVAFQPEGTSYAFIGTRGGQVRLVVDGTESGTVEPRYPPSLRYSPDGNHLAFIGKQVGASVAIVDAKELPAKTHNVLDWGYSPDSSKFYAAAEIGGLLRSAKDLTYIVDGVPGPTFEHIPPIAFSSDGKHYAFAGVNDKVGLNTGKGVGAIVLDGKIVATFKGHGYFWVPLFPGFGLSNERHYESAPFVEGGEGDLVDFFTNSEGVSNPRFDAEGKLVYAARRAEGDEVVFVADQAGPRFDKILSEVSFSPDLKHFAYLARTGNEISIVRDNLPIAKFVPAKKGGEERYELALSDDGLHIAFPNEIAGGATMMIDGQPGASHKTPYFEFGDFSFSRDGHHYCYNVQGLQGVHTVMNVDGNESKLYDGIWGKHFSEDAGSVTSFARDGRRLVRLTYTVQENN